MFYVTQDKQVVVSSTVIEDAIEIDESTYDLLFDHGSIIDIEFINGRCKLNVSLPKYRRSALLEIDKMIKAATPNVVELQTGLTLGLLPIVYIGDLRMTGEDAVAYCKAALDKWQNHVTPLQASRDAICNANTLEEIDQALSVTE